MDCRRTGKVEATCASFQHARRVRCSSQAQGGTEHGCKPISRIIDRGSPNCSHRQAVSGPGNEACGRIAAPQQVPAAGSAMIRTPPEYVQTSSGGCGCQPDKQVANGVWRERRFGATRTAQGPGTRMAEFHSSCSASARRATMQRFGTGTSVSHSGTRSTLVSWLTQARGVAPPRLCATSTHCFPNPHLLS